MKPALARIVDVRGAALANALDPKRQDQEKWMRIYAHMVGVKDFIPDEDS